MSALSFVKRAVATAIDLPGYASYHYHSLSRQVRRLPLGVTLARAAQVINGTSPLIDTFHNAETWLIALLGLGRGIMEVREIGHENLRVALEKQGIERIVVEDYLAPTFDPNRALVVIKRAAAGMESNKRYQFCLDPWSAYPEYLAMVKYGPTVIVTSRAKARPDNYQGL